MKTKEEILQLLKDVGTCENMEDVRAKLVDLESDIDSEFTEFELVIQERDDLKIHNDKLTKANMDLYLKSGSKVDDPNNFKQKEPEKKEFKNLFNEKGELK